MMRGGVAVPSNRSGHMSDYRTILRRLALRDDRYIELVLAEEAESVALSGLDCRTHSLVRIGALVAMDGPPPSYMSSVERALHAGATHEEIVGALLALLPIVGVARAVSAAPNLALALGHDTAEAFELADGTESLR
jgi:alkylhydroperoxidase/carboxymuconolactone decarboxylase family protein YurZ